ncbi:MAG: hypothetical protein OQK55_07095 [Thermoanaerobaculales bacterium]|nr:hypothetical protein [Thermoanaerobaculales bacterium]
MGKLDPVKNLGEAEVSLRCRVHGASYGRTGIEKALGSGKSGSFRSTAQLCQVGTTPGNCPIQIQLPKAEPTTEIENRYPQTPIRCHQSAPSPQYQPGLTMGSEYVEGPLKPVSTATSDEKVGQATDAESRPGSQIHTLVDLWLTVFPKISEVLFEIGRPVQHEKTRPPEIWHAICFVI